MIAAVETARLPGLQPLTAAARVLGRRIAHVPLVRHVAESEVSETRLAGIGALVLLGDTEVADRLVERAGRARDGFTRPDEAVALIELSFWCSRSVRDALLERAKQHPAQVVARVAMDVRLAAAGRQ